MVCVGAGASGLHLIYKMKREFTNFSLDVYEKNSDIGGTWYENRYPGCRFLESSHSPVTTYASADIAI
jgi:cation diffusion facilitator CzcD-associated flavoprotein CzcO